MPIYLDNNATTRPDDRVADAMTLALRESWANPSSIHRPGQVARQHIDLARQSLARLIGAKPRQLTLCSSGTEAIDLAIRGSLLAMGALGARDALGTVPTILTSRVEHSAVRELAEALAKEAGVRVVWVELDRDGLVSAAAVERHLANDQSIALVSVQWANNETGSIHPVHEIAGACRACALSGRRVLFHCDATQWVGKMPITTDELDRFDLITFSPHKFHGPKGVGVLWARAGVRTAPLIHGEQELGRRGGTENVPGIVGAGVAAVMALEWLSDPQHRARVAHLRDRFEQGVLKACSDASVNGPVDLPGDAPGTRRLWNTTNIAFPRLEAEALLLLLSERGVCASAGAACSSGSLDPSPVLQAMGIPPERAHGSLRFSLSRETTEVEIDEAIQIVCACVARLRGSMSAIT